MTIALLIKVNDGMVLASDSATTLVARMPDGSQAVSNTYNNANKVFNLHKGLPIGAMTWGLGNIGPASIATIAKDLRRRFHGDDTTPENWAIGDNSYEIESIAEKTRAYLHDGKYELVEQAASEEGVQAPQLGFLVAGYSRGSDEPRAYVMNFDSSGEASIDEVLANDTGAAWWGQPEAISRILTGLSPAVPNALVNLGVGLTPEQAQEVALGIQQQIKEQIAPPAMPIQDAIDLAEFLVHATIQFVRFSPGPPTVGGPIEIATITKHEGFRWVRRKHFFDSRLNPPFGG
jgi:hypothetical protein